MNLHTEVRLLGARFTVRGFLLLLVTFLLMEGIFSWIFIRNSVLTEGFIKLTGLLIYAFMFLNFLKLKRSEQIVLMLFSLIMVRLVLESLAKYDSFFKQLTMFTVLFPVVYVLFMKYLLRYLQMDLLDFMAKFYVISYIVFMILFGRGFSFSLDQVDMDDYGPFSGDSRVIHASHILMMIIPLLWFVHRYVTERKFKFLCIAMFCIAVIVIHQHRSVWSASLVAIVFYVMASVRNRTERPGKYFSLILQSLAILMVGYFVVAALAPGFTGFLADRFSEIFDPSKEGSTGNFRIEQREVYGEMFFQRPFFGWTFEGFEMPNPLVDWWPEKTGQHFHEGYMEMLFYHGIIGLLLKYGVLFYFMVKIFSKRLSPQSIILMSLGIAGLLFSFNYVLPIVFWGHMGMALYYLERDAIPVAAPLKPVIIHEPKFSLRKIIQRS